MFEPIRYETLNARQKEIFNFQKLSATLADYGFNCIKLADDWGGADFIAFHVITTKTLKDWAVYGLAKNFFLVNWKCIFFRQYQPKIAE
jgi:hypothetical protein